MPRFDEPPLSVYCRRSLAYAIRGHVSSAAAFPRRSLHRAAGQSDIILAAAARDAILGHAFISVRRLHASRARITRRADDCIEAQLRLKFLLAAFFGTISNRRPSS